MELWQWAIIAQTIVYIGHISWMEYKRMEYEKQRRDMYDMFVQIENCFKSYAEFTKAANSNFCWLSSELNRLKAKEEK